MKETKTIAIILTILLIPALGIAASQKVKGNTVDSDTAPSIQNTNAQTIHESGTGNDDPDTKVKGSQQGLISAQNVDEGENDVDPNNGNQNRIQLNKDNEETGSENAIQRRSKVANAVQTMLQISEKNEGVGQKIRIIAQNQNRDMEEIEENMESVKQRSKFLKFLIGPKYGQINSIEDRLEEHSGRLEELKQLKDELSEEDAEMLDTQILAMEEIKKELLTELNLEESGFTLFGWLVKLFN
jgi:hypothetical protein